MKNIEYKDIFDISEKALSIKTRVPITPIRQTPFITGKNVRGMSNVSPNATFKMKNKNSFSTAKNYFPGSKISKKGNTNIIADLIGPFIEKNGFYFNNENYFFDNNFNGTYGDGGDILAFKLLLFVSTDGIKVKECYEVTNPDDDEVILFLETDEGFSKQVLYGKMSEKVRKQFTDKDGNLKSNLFDSQIMKGVKKYADINQKTVEQLMKKGYIENSPIKEGFFKYLKYSAIGVTAFPKLVGWGLNKIGSGIDFLKIPDEFWDTENEEYLFQKDNLIKKLSISQSIITSIENLLKHKDGLDITDVLPDTVEEMAQYLLSKMRAFIDNYNAFIKKSIDKIYKVLEESLPDFIFDGLSELIAFYCGRWNALVDFVSGIFKFFGLLLEAPFKIAKDFQATLEYLDNFWDIINHDDFFDNLFEGAQLTYEKIKRELKSKNADEYSWTRVAYFSGYGLCTIATFFIPLGQLGSLAKNGKFGEIMAKFTEEISRGFTKGASIITQKTAQAYQNSLKILQQIGEILVNGGEKFYAFLNKIWKKIVDFFIKNKDAFGRLKELMGIGLSRVTSEILIAFKIGVRKIGNASFGAAGGLPNNIYKLYYKGILIFEGGEKSVADLAKKLKSMSKNAAEKYLDDILERVFLIGKRFEEHIESGHVKIEIVNGQLPPKIIINGVKEPNPSRVFEEYEYLLGKGRAKITIKPPYQAKIKAKGGMHMLKNFNKKLIKIYEHVSVEFLPTGEKVLISKIKYWVEELGEFKVKRDKHTFFPKEWDLEKIKSVVKEASENITFADGNKFQGITKNGVKLEFYIDKNTREILTAYIIF